MQTDKVIITNMGLVLLTPEGEFKIRRQGGNPFWDETIASL
jgi:hypothetical protein